MAISHNLKFARGTSTKRNVSTEKLDLGQPFYETDTRTLYIGDGTTELNSNKPITATPLAHTHGASSITSGCLSIIRGGTGVTSNPSMLVNLSSNTSASVFVTSPKPGVTGVLSISNGGTGVSDESYVLTDLSSEAQCSPFSPSSRPGVTGVLPVEHGGTGVTNAESVLSDLLGVEASKDELNILSGLVTTTKELNCLQGIKSNVQEQLDELSTVTSNTYANPLYLHIVTISKDSIEEVTGDMSITLINNDPTLYTNIDSVLSAVENFFKSNNSNDFFLGASGCVRAGSLYYPVSHIAVKKDALTTVYYVGKDNSLSYVFLQDLVVSYVFDKVVQIN